MRELAVLLGDLEGEDPAEALGAVAALRRRLEMEEEVQVRRARLAGLTWALIAARLGVSKQAVHKKHAAGRRDRRSP